MTIIRYEFPWSFYSTTPSYTFLFCPRRTTRGESCRFEDQTELPWLWPRFWSEFPPGGGRRDVADGSHSWVTTVITISYRCDQTDLTFLDPNPERKNLKRYNWRNIMRRKYIWISEYLKPNCIMHILLPSS